MERKVIFTEEFRPKTLEECALPSRIINELKGGLSQNILLYSSSPGTGKTTLTKILTEGYQVLRINGSASGIDKVREDIEEFSATYSMFDGEKVVILEEMDGLTINAFQALRAVIETYAENVRFIGNCNNINKIPAPIQSRFNCIPVYPITTEERQEWFVASCKRVQTILERLEMKCEPALIGALVKRYTPNMRSVINIIQSLYVQGITEIKESDISTGENALNSDNNDMYMLFELILNKETSQLQLYEFLKRKFSDNAEDVIQGIANKFIEYSLSNNKLNGNMSSKIGNVAVATSNYMNQLPASINKFITMYALVTTLNTIAKS